MPKKKNPPPKFLPPGTPVRRNRKERKGANVYRVESLYGASDHQLLKLEGEEHFLEGEIDQWLIISVPETIRVEVAAQYKQQLQIATGRPVMIITHNVQFVKLNRLSPSEAAKVIKRAEDNAFEDIEEAEAAARIKEERAKLVSGDGSGSGDSVDGDRDSGNPELDSDDGDGQEAAAGIDASDSGEGTQEDEDPSERGRPEKDEAPVGSDA